MDYRVVHTFITLILFILLCGPVSAYYLSIDAPAEVKVGEPFNVSGSTNTPPPDKIDIIFSQSINIPVEIDRKSIVITEKGENNFNVTFKTEGLEKGNYKIEGISQSKRDFSANSRSLRVIKLVDRSDLITFSSPKWQEFEKELNIEAKISGYSENAIQMEVRKGGEILFGPESIPVSHGSVKYQLPIEEPGSYEVSFSDYDGYIGTYTIAVEEKDNYHQTDDETSDGILSSEKVTTEQEPSVTNTPESEENNTPTTKIKPSVSEKISGVSSSADASRESPAYFLVIANKTPVSIQTSDNEDWVMEYKTSSDSAEVKVNEEMGGASETITLSDPVSEIYLKVYPYSYKSSQKVTINSDVASSVSLSDSAAKAFGAPPRYGDSKEGKTETKSPLPVWVILVSIGICLIISGKRK